MSDPRQSSIDDAFFWEGAAAGKLLIERCSDCGTLRHPPAPMCGVCGSLAHDAAESSGHGRIVSWISSLHPNRPDDPPRIVVLVQLEEGTRLVANLVDPPDEGPFDDRLVRVEFCDVDGTTMPCFRIAS
jgi:3-oxo-4,17-pregnadiene-20-carboxyl-CoA hydratase alpha subunit